jgi:hypothetical protein
MSTEPEEPICTPQDVAVWLRARTQDDEGREQGLFTEATRPTVLQVEATIEVAHAMVALRVGWESPDACLAGYRQAVSLAAACIIEKSYFPEQIADNRSAYVQLNEELTAALQGLYQCVVDGGLGPGAGGESGSAGAYDLCTPYQPCGAGPSLFVPANWNNPQAYDVDDPYEPSAAQAWLVGMQETWRGVIDADGRPIAPAPRHVDTRGTL